MHRAFPLELIEVATPCHASWDAMTGDDRSRFCGECQRHIYNLSGMTRADAEALVQEKEGKLCVRFYRRADMRVMTADCPVGLAALRQKLLRRAGMVVGAVVGVLGSIFVIPALFGENRASAYLRDVQPFAALLNWVDPNPPGIIVGTTLPLPPPPTGAPIGGEGPPQPPAGNLPEQGR
jgi:hypothetical protein